MRRARWKTSARRLAAWALALLLVAGLAPRHGLAAEEDVYLTAVNDVVLEMNAETMPFWSNGALYVSNRVFEGTDLGVTYVRNETMGLAVLYTPGQTCASTWRTRPPPTSRGTATAFTPSSGAATYFSPWI